MANPEQIKAQSPIDGWDVQPRPIPEELKPKLVIPPGHQAIPLGHIAMVGDFPEETS